MHPDPSNFLCIACPLIILLGALIVFWGFMECLALEGVREFEEKHGGPFP